LISVAGALTASAAIAAEPAGVSGPVEPQVVQVALVEEAGASERIDYSGKLRMLSQRIPAAACNVAAEIATEQAVGLLDGATKEFDKIVNALEFGDPDLSIIGEEKRRKTIARIHDLREVWLPVKAAAEAMVAGDHGAAHVDLIIAQNMGVLDAAQLLVSELVGEYSNPAAMLQADSMLIDISGRQRMLSQKISKESCMIWSGRGTADTTAALAGTMDMFEVSLMALRNGMAEAGIKNPPNADIEAGLDVVIGEWAVLMPVLEGLKAGQIPDEATRAATFAGLNTLMTDMNKVVGMYTEAAKLGI
jgi:hypothetical protein